MAANHWLSISAPPGVNPVVAGGWVRQDADFCFRHLFGRLVCAKNQAKPRLLVLGETTRRNPVADEKRPIGQRVLYSLEI